MVSQSDSPRPAPSARHADTKETAYQLKEKSGEVFSTVIAAVTARRRSRRGHPSQQSPEPAVTRASSHPSQQSPEPAVTQASSHPEPAVSENGLVHSKRHKTSEIYWKMMREALGLPPPHTDAFLMHCVAFRHDASIHIRIVAERNATDEKCIRAVPAGYTGRHTGRAHRLWAPQGTPVWGGSMWSCGRWNGYIAFSLCCHSIDI